MLSQIYTILFIISLALLIILIAKYHARIYVYYILLFVSIMLYTFANMQIASASDLGMIIYANQIAYLSSSFSPFFLMMCIADLCKTKIKGSFQSFCVCYSLAIFTMVSTLGTTSGYYNSISMTKKYGITIFVKEYGPLHIFYPLYILSIFAICMWIIIAAFRRKKDVSYITSILLLCCMLLTFTVYIGEKVVHLSLELVPFAYVASAIVILILLRRISLYNVVSISAGSMVGSTSYGFFICDSNGRFLGANDTAKAWFPEISNLAIDVSIGAENTEFLKQIGKWIRSEDDREQLHLEQGERIIEITHSVIKERRVNSIQCVYLRDDTKQQKYTNLVKKYNENLERDVNAKTEKMRQIQEDIIISMASIVENRDNNTGGHIARTSDIVKIFVGHLSHKQVVKNLTPELAQCIIKAAPLHDFGKIGIPDVILNKPGKFEPEEYEIMKEHSAKGAVIVERILQNSDDKLFKKVAVNVAHYHHEKWDGKGYPEGLKEKEIPFEARVMALADVFDALVSKRVYKESFNYDKAFSIIEESSGTHFDPVLCKAFLECRKELETLYDSYED